MVAADALEVLGDGWFGRHGSERYRDLVAEPETCEHCQDDLEEGFCPWGCEEENAEDVAAREDAAADAQCNLENPESCESCT
jgi:hypothetical protein